MKTLSNFSNFNLSQIVNGKVNPFGSLEGLSRAELFRELKGEMILENKKDFNEILEKNQEFEFKKGSVSYILTSEA